jgi:AcrR family transcriptional regulator
MRKRQIKRLDQERTIIDQAGLLFWENGYDRTSMKDIARACGFEQGNIYNYFHSKEQLLYEVIRKGTTQVISEAVEKFKTNDGTKPEEQLRSLIKLTTKNALGIGIKSRLLLDVELRNLSPYHQTRIIKLRDSFDKTVRAVIRRGIKSGDFDETDEKLAGFAIASTILRNRLWFSTTERLSAEEVAEFLSDFILNSLRYNRRKKAKT